VSNFLFLIGLNSFLEFTDMYQHGEFFTGYCILLLQCIDWYCILALNAVPIKPNIKPLCLLEILVFDVGNGLVKDLRSSWKYLINLADSLVTKMF
jgi:hypothetical protein